MSEITSKERRILLVIALVQFINILDFMMVMPLGPGISRSLGYAFSDHGVVGASYTLAAFVAGLVGALFLDRFDRRSALCVAMIGLAFGTMGGAFAQDLPTLLLARIVAGIFGGPATALSYSIVADTVPPERRGRAMGFVMGGFAAASVFGVPAGLWLAKLGSWRTPFWGVGVFGLVIAAMAFSLLPKMRDHLGATTVLLPISAMLRGPVMMALLLSFVAFFSGFAVIPSISGYITYNLHYPEAELDRLYLVGGIVSLITTRVAGVLVDRFGAAIVGTVGTSFLCFIIFAWLGHSSAWLPIMVVFSGFMLAMGLRNVALTTLSSRVPNPQERARYGSIESATRHIASASGGLMSSKVLTEQPDHTLLHMETLATISIAVALLAIPVFWIVQSQVRRALSPPRSA